MNRVMLSRKNGPQEHLLTTFRQKPKTRRASPGVNDAPLSSEDEEEEEEAAEDEPELPNEDILLGRPQGRNARSRRPPPVTSSPVGNRTTRGKNAASKGATSSTTSSSPKRPAEEEAEVDSSPDPLSQDLFGLFDPQSSQGQRRTKRMKSYGGGMGNASRNGSLAVQQIRRMDGLKKRSSSLGKIKGKGVNGFKIPLREDDFEDDLRKVEEESPPSSKFKNPTEIFAVRKVEEESPPSSKFKNPTEIYSVNDPSAESKMGGFKVPVFLPEDEIDPLATSEPPRRSSRLLVGQEKDGKDSNAVIKATPTSSTTDNSVSSTTAPIEIDGLSSDTSTSPLSSPPDSPLHETTSSTTEKGDGSVCPLCNQRLDAELKRLMSELGRLNFKKQEEICKQHKIKSAKAEWKNRGYPVINWTRLSTKRIPSFYRNLEDILQGKTRSVYREGLEARIQTGKKRTLKQRMMMNGAEGGEEEALMMTTGYYGPRGGQLFEEKILSRFSGLIRQLAGRDSIMASRGVSEYIQGVLVPELATLLIMQDMSVDSEAARKIMRESTEMGELINDEQG